MEKLSSVKNAYIQHMRLLAGDAAYRREKREYVCDGIKLLREALNCGAEVTSVLWKETPESVVLPDSCSQYIAAAELYDRVSPMKSSPGPLFSVAVRADGAASEYKNAIVLENVQDPGNVGTVVRTANAFGISAVILTGACADLYSFKTARATMGAIFRQRVEYVPLENLSGFLSSRGLKLYGAALGEDSSDIRGIDVKHSAVAVGSEGHGLSAELLAMCEKSVIIPMSPESESLNAAVAASVIMWEMSR